MKVDRHRRARRIFWRTAGTLLVVSWVMTVSMWAVSAAAFYAVSYYFPHTVTPLAQQMRRLDQTGWFVTMAKGEVAFASWKYTDLRGGDEPATMILLQPEGIALSGPPWAKISLYIGSWKRVWTPEYFPWHANAMTFPGRLGFRIEASTSTQHLTNIVQEFRFMVVPFWAISLPLGLVMLSFFFWRVFVIRRRNWRRLHRRCVACGYDLRSSAGACPECGARRQGGRGMMGGSPGAGG